MTATVTFRDPRSALRSRWKLYTVTALVERVLSCDEHFVQTDGDVSGTQVQISAACSLWQKGRVEPHPGRDGQNDLVGTPSGSCQGSAVRLRMKVYDEPTEPGEFIFHSNVWTEETSWQEASSFGRQRKRFWKVMSPRKASEDYLGPAALIGLHVRNCWFGGRAHLCEHLRGVAPDEGNRLDMDNSRQVDKRQMDAAERMNSLEGVGETAPSPPFKRARLRKPLHGEQ